MRVVLLDAEADGYLYDATQLWVVCTEDATTGEQRDFVFPKDTSDFLSYVETVDVWVIHNGSGYDGPLLQRLFPTHAEYFANSKIIDTLVVSRRHKYKDLTTHSIKEWGIRLGKYKGDWKDFSKYSKGMHSYCRQDVEILKGIWLRLRKYCTGALGAAEKQGYSTEKDMNTLSTLMQHNGFKFDVPKATDILADVTEEMTKLETEFQITWPPTLVVEKELKYRTKADGTLFAAVQTAISSYPKTDTYLNDEGERMLRCYSYKPFSPASPKDRIDKLWDAGWSPYVKTKTHYKATKEKSPDPDRMAKLSRYGWACNEDNLATLPKSAPEGAQKLARWLTLEGRRSSLQEWINCTQEDGRIHGKLWHIGAWTERCSHSAPNTANIASPWPSDVTPKTPVEVIKSLYDHKLRECWCVDEGNYLVGTDADGIQLRILAHYMQSEDYVNAIINGDKKKGTDIHNLNKDALGPICRSRDDAKTFIYAWLLGAGVAKVATILGCSQAQAKQAVNNFLDSLPELKALKNKVIPYDATRGYFIGLDGRRVHQNSSYLMLAGYLQNGEATIMKMANLRWDAQARQEKINFKQVGFVHDEWQTEVADSYDAAERLGFLQRQSIEEVGKELKLFCPLEGSTDIGKNWYETH